MRNDICINVEEAKNCLRDCNNNLSGVETAIRKFNQDFEDFLDTFDVSRKYDVANVVNGCFDKIIKANQEAFECVEYCEKRIKSLQDALSIHFNG